MPSVAIVCNGSENTSLYPTFVLASSAASLEYEVTVFFTPASVDALKPGVLEGIEGKGMPPMRELVEGLKTLGGKLVLCELCLEAKGVTMGELRDDLVLSGATGFLSDIKNATITFSF